MRGEKLLPLGFDELLHRLLRQLSHFPIRIHGKGVVDSRPKGNQGFHVVGTHFFGDDDALTDVLGGVVVAVVCVVVMRTGFSAAAAAAAFVVVVSFAASSSLLKWASR